MFAALFAGLAIGAVSGLLIGEGFLKWEIGVDDEGCFPTAVTAISFFVLLIVTFIAALIWG